MSAGRYVGALLACLVLAAHPAMCATGPVPASDYVKPLGNGKFQVGKIVVDREKRIFTLPARVLVVEKPLEYLLTAKGGMKAYETLLETDVVGTEFNLACILVGLESAEKRRAAFQFSLEPLEGPRIDVTLSWKAGGRTLTVPALEALVDPGQLEQESVEWVYVGSYMADGNRFAADLTGTLIGFVHDPNTVIDAREGLGIGAYGSINGNAALLPPVGTQIELTVTVLPAAAAQKEVSQP